MSRVMIVTGAGSGIGAPAAERAAREGWQVTICGRRAGPLDAVAARTGGRPVTADVTDPAAVQDLVDGTVAEAARLDCVVANAGVMRSGSVADLDPAEWELTLRTNLTAPYLLARAALPHLLGGGGWGAGDLVAGDGRRVPAGQAQHPPPVQPSKIIAVHLNHRSRVEEFHRRLHHRQRLRPARLPGHRRRIDAPGQGRGHALPARPRAGLGWDFAGKSLRTYVNGRLAQDGSTDEMAWDMHYLVADIARLITLLPSDVLLSGTPANSRPVQPGDVVEVEAEGLGRLVNHIVEGPAGVRSDVGAQPTESEEVRSTALGGDWELRGIRPPRRS